MNKSERFFDKASRKSKPEPGQTASKIIESSKGCIEKDNYVLDFGCDSGAITNKLAKQAKAIDAIDISSGKMPMGTVLATLDNLLCDASGGWSRPRQLGAF